MLGSVVFICEARVLRYLVTDVVVVVAYLTLNVWLVLLLWMFWLDFGFLCLFFIAYVLCALLICLLMLVL